MSTTFTCSSNSGIFLPGYAVTHYIATVAMLKLCVQAVTAFNSFHLLTCLHHQITRCLFMWICYVYIFVDIEAML